MDIKASTLTYVARGGSHALSVLLSKAQTLLKTWSVFSVWVSVWRVRVSGCENGWRFHLLEPVLANTLSEKVDQDFG